MVNLNFQQPLFQSLTSHNPSEIILICWFAAQETFLIIINVEKLFSLIFLGETGFFVKWKFKITAFIRNKDFVTLHIIDE